MAGKKYCAHLIWYTEKKDIMTKMVKVVQLKKVYNSVSAVNSISFEINRGEIFALIGLNGAGKSTTLKIIAGLLTPTSGSVYIDGINIQKEPDKIRKYISYLPEDSGAYKNLSGLNYLKFMAGLYGNDQAEIEEFVQKGIEISRLGNRLKERAGNYSKGMIRKLLLARTVMISPKLAILDEPTSGLDVMNSIIVRDIIKQMAKEGMAVLLSSHNMLEIEYLSDRVGIIERGIIYEIGSSLELKNKYKAKNLEEVFEKAVGFTERKDSE